MQGTQTHTPAHIHTQRTSKFQMNAAFLSVRVCLRCSDSKMPTALIFATHISGNYLPSTPHSNSESFSLATKTEEI